MCFRLHFARKAGEIGRFVRAGLSLFFSYGYLHCFFLKKILVDLGNIVISGTKWQTEKYDFIKQVISFIITNIYRVWNDLRPPPKHSLNQNNLKKSKHITSKYNQCPSLLPNFQYLSYYLMSEHIHSFVRVWTLKIGQKCPF